MDQETLKKILCYDPENGKFTWLVPMGKSKPGTQAGKVYASGYTLIHINGKSYSAHRLAWLYIHGHFPKIIDHINGEKSDNRISNLRSVTAIQNTWNSKRSRTNSSGYKGVSWRADLGKWQATITVNGVIKNLGHFKEPANAHNAYKKAAEQYFGEYANHGEIDESKATNFVYVPSYAIPIGSGKPTGRPVGRPKTIRDETIPAAFNLTKKQISWLKLKASEAGVSASEILRKVIDNSML